VARVAPRCDSDHRMGGLVTAAARVELLRRGRGGGYREALRAGTAASAEVVACVLDDPRWDPQVESRSEYYAHLLLALGADVGPICERALDPRGLDERDLQLPIDVLVELARRDHALARDTIAAAVRHGSGADRWLRIIEYEPFLRAVVDADAVFPSPPERIADAAPALSASLSSEELLARVTSSRAAREARTILAMRSDPATTAALRAAAGGEAEEQRAVALRVLGSQGCADFLGDAERFLRVETSLSRAERVGRSRMRTAFLRYLGLLPPALTLPRARRWLGERWPLSLAAREIFAKHATADDREMLEQAGASALRETDMYAVCAIVDALATIGVVESLPLLAEVYRAAPYSYARGRVVEALLPHATAPVAAALLEESLWDCDGGTRERACGAAPRSLATDERLDVLARDPHEEASVRAAAARALGR